MAMQDFRYARYTARNTNCRETASTKGNETCVHARQSEHGMRFEGESITLPPFEELIAASMGDCRRYRSVSRFATEKYVLNTSVRVAVVTCDVFFS